MSTQKPARTTAQRQSARARQSAKLRVVARSSRPIDAREERLFRSLDTDNDGRVHRSDLIGRLAEAGLGPEDPRLQASLSALNAQEKGAADDQVAGLRREDFCPAIRHTILLIERALQGNLVIPDFAEFRDTIDRLHAVARQDRSGKAADYIPQLDLPMPALDRFGVAVCTVDGQRHAVGDAREFFPIESTCKPVNYCLALEEHGAEAVHAFVGHEPSGLGFNELSLDKQNRPHNPMINAGAIMSSALIGLTEKRRMADEGRTADVDARGWAGTRFDGVMASWQALCGGDKPRFSTPVYLSERDTADRNFALGYFMREKKAFPAGVDLHDVLDFYFQCCSIELTAEMMSVVAATLANGGICPVSGERVFRTETVQSCLSLMSSSGMYDYSGEFAYSIGLPAKSGVSGGIMIVVPNVMGLCAWSPRLDALGNSVRGVGFCRQLVETFNVHNYDALAGGTAKRDPRVSRTQARAVKVNEMIWAASKGDVGAIQQQLLHGATPRCADYDLRTPLHLAAAENQAEMVEFFLRQDGSDDALNPRDRWGGTPLDDACLHGHETIIRMLERAGGRRGDVVHPAESGLKPVSAASEAESHRTAELIWAAADGDLDTIWRLVARGVALDVADYDLRTPLHLAAAEGQADVVAYLCDRLPAVSPLDRWGNTPLDDALRHGHEAIADQLRRRGGTTGRSEVAEEDRDTADMPA